MANLFNHNIRTEYILPPKNPPTEADHKVCIMDVMTGEWECGGSHNPTSLDVYEWLMNRRSEENNL